MIIIGGFFLPFINTCDRKTVINADGQSITIKNYSLIKPDGENHSGIGYMIEYADSSNGLFFILLGGLLIPIYLLIVHLVFKTKVGYTDNGLLLTGTSVYIWLLFEDPLINLRYGAVVIAAAYFCGLITGITLQTQNKKVDQPL